MYRIPAPASLRVPHAWIAPPVDPRVQCPEASPQAEHPGAGPNAAPAIDPHAGGDASGPLPGVRRRGDPNLAPRCGAKARTTGCACRAPAMANGRCRMHGGKSTGPRTAEGFSRLAAARTTHGKSCAAKRAQQRYVADADRALAAAGRRGAAAGLSDVRPGGAAVVGAGGTREAGGARRRRGKPKSPTGRHAPFFRRTTGRRATRRRVRAGAGARRGRGRRGGRRRSGRRRGRSARRRRRGGRGSNGRGWSGGWCWRRGGRSGRKTPGRDPMHQRAAGVGRVVPRKAHTPLDGAGMGVEASGVKLRGTEAAAGSGMVKIATAPHAPLDGAGRSAVMRTGHGTVGDAGMAAGGVGGAAGGATGAGQGRQGFRSAREERHATYDKAVAAGWAEGTAVRRHRSQQRGVRRRRRRRVGGGHRGLGGGAGGEGGDGGGGGAGRARVRQGAVDVNTTGCRPRQRGPAAVVGWCRGPYRSRP